MTRKYMAALTATVSIAFVAIVSSTGCQSSGIGDPCIPEAEYAPTFTGFDYSEVNVESKSFQCLTRLCLVNHFQGRVSCPYGQVDNATSSVGGTTTGVTCDGKSTSTSQNDRCCLPGVDTPVTAAGDSTTAPTKSGVKPNCSDRTADKAVYCSCRCANTDGKTDDGSVYCGCPDGFECTQLVAAIGPGNSQLTGAYCTKKGTKYALNTSCQETCDPTAKPGGAQYCGPTNSAAH